MKETNHTRIQKKSFIPLAIQIACHFTSTQFLLVLHITELPHDKTNKMVRAAAQSDLSLHCALNGYLRTQVFFMQAAKTRIRLGGCQG